MKSCFLQEHILVHWEELGDEEGFQCSTCGKVFGSGNHAAFVKHLATHDDEVQKACDCSICLREESKKGKKRKAPPLKPITKKSRSDSDVAEEATTNIGETIESQENNVDNSDRNSNIILAFNLVSNQSVVHYYKKHVMFYFLCVQVRH